MAVCPESDHWEVKTQGVVKTQSITVPTSEKVDLLNIGGDRDFVDRTQKALTMQDKIARWNLSK